MPDKKTYELHCGNSKEIIPELVKQGTQVDSIVTDPPYHLTSIVKRFSKTSIDDDNETGKKAKSKSNPHARTSRGFMGKEWDGGDIAQDVEFWKQCYDILKPGGYLLAFSSTRTYHRMAVAIEDAGFEIRDQIGWLYGSGFPKSHNVSKAIDKKLGREREVVGKSNRHTSRQFGKDAGDSIYGTFDGGVPDVTAPASDEAKQWDGWGSALKPAWEPIVLARKPLSEGTLAENVLKHGTGGINIDACRVPIDESVDDPRLGGKGSWKTNKMAKNVYEGGYVGDEIASSSKGRFPANVIHDGSEEVLDEFAKYGTLKSGSNNTRQQEGYFGAGDTKHGSLGEAGDVQVAYGDSGSAARFFYSSKATKEDRAGSEHPTVKPITLMSYLCKLVTPPGGIVLDPFAGSGTTGQAAVESGFYPIMIEMEKQYQEDIKNRMKKFENDVFYELFESEDKNKEGNNE